MTHNADAPFYAVARRPEHGAHALILFSQYACRIRSGCRAAVLEVEHAGACQWSKDKHGRVRPSLDSRHRPPLDAMPPRRVTPRVQVALSRSPGENLMAEVPRSFYDALYGPIKLIRKKMDPRPYGPFNTGGGWGAKLRDDGDVGVMNQARCDRRTCSSRVTRAVIKTPIETPIGR